MMKCREWQTDRRPAMEKNKQTDGHTSRQTGRQTDTQTDIQTDRQAGRQTDRQTNMEQTDRQADRQADRHPHRQRDRPNSRQAHAALAERQTGIQIDRQARTDRQGQRQGVGKAWESSLLCATLPAQGSRSGFNTPLPAHAKLWWAYTLSRHFTVPSTQQGSP